MKVCKLCLNQALQKRRLCKICFAQQRKQTNLKYNNKNREIKNQKNRQYYYKNKDVIAAQKKEYLLNNKEKVYDKNKIWKVNNKDKIRLSENIRRNKNKEFINFKARQRRKENIFTRLRSNIKSLLSQALKTNNLSKNKSINQYLPYSIKQLKEHLQENFESWMNWNNYGIYNCKIWQDNDSLTWTWQLDHITPQSDLPYTSIQDDNFKKCWALNNLRPYSAKLNCIEGAARTRHKKDK